MENRILEEARQVLGYERGQALLRSIDASAQVESDRRTQWHAVELFVFLEDALGCLPIFISENEVFRDAWRRFARQAEWPRAWLIECDRPSNRGAVDRYGRFEFFLVEKGEALSDLAVAMLALVGVNFTGAEQAGFQDASTKAMRRSPWRTFPSPQQHDHELIVEFPRVRAPDLMRQILGWGAQPRQVLARQPS
jgi:hypothetical protein